MFNQMTIDKLNMMKLYGMTLAFSEQIESPRYNELSFEERFGMVIDKEMTHRENKKLKNLDFRVDRGLSRQPIMTLSRGDWIQKKQNVIITGATGAGKTYIACALGNSACRAGLSANYFRLPKLLEALTIARADGSYGKMLIRLAKVKLLIVDDWGFAPLTDKERRIFLDILEDRYDISSTIISSQLPVENWHDNIADPTVADAICDRLIHNAHRIRLTGDESMRKNYSSLKETQKQ